MCVLDNSGMCAQEAHRSLLIVAPKWEQPKGPSGVEWYHKLWGSHTTECYLAKKRNEYYLLAHSKMGMNLINNVEQKKQDMKQSLTMCFNLHNILKQAELSHTALKCRDKRVLTVREVIAIRVTMVVPFEGKGEVWMTREEEKDQRVGPVIFLALLPCRECVPRGIDTAPHPQGWECAPIYGSDLPLNSLSPWADFSDHTPTPHLELLLIDNNP